MDFNDNHELMSASWSVKNQLNKQSIGNIMLTDKNVFVPGGGFSTEPGFISGINIYYPQHLNKVITYAPVFYVGNRDANKQYVWANGAMVHAHHTGLENLTAGTSIAAVPVMCKVGTKNKRYEGRYFLETVNACKYKYELSNLLIALRTVFELYEDSREFFSQADGYLNEALNTNSLWFDLNAAVVSADSSLTSFRITEAIVRTTKRYWADGMGAGFGDSASKRPKHYTTPLLTSKSVLNDLDGMLVRFNEGVAADGSIKDQLKGLASRFKIMTSLINFIQSVVINPVAIIQSSSTAVIQPGSVMSVMLLA